MSTIILNETATPSGQFDKTVIYMDSADGKLYASIDNASPVELGGTGTTIDAGTSFPGLPATGDYFFRTDLGRLFRFGGAGWETAALWVEEGSAPIGTTGRAVIYMDSSDHRLYAKVHGDTPVELGGTTIDAGTSFPGTPSTGDYFFRTDLGRLFRFGGAGWETAALRVEEGSAPSGVSGQAVIYMDSADGKLYANVDNAGSQNLLIEIGTSFPVSPSLNELFFNGSMGGVFRWNGLTWNGVGDIHTVPTKNIIFNSAFAVWQRGTGSTNCPAGSVTYLADRWFVLPSGASVTQEQSTSVSSPRSTYSLRVNGAASVTSCVVAQRLEAIDTPQETMTIQARIYNDTGAPITPDLVVDTPSATDDWTTSTNRLTQALQACPDASWTQVYYTFTTSGMTDIANGVQIGFDFGALTTGYVLVTQAQVERGASLTTYRAPPIGDELRRCQYYYYRETYEAVTDICPSIGNASDGSRVSALWKLPVSMRTEPSLGVSDQTGFQVDFGPTADTTSITLHRNTLSSIMLFATHNGSLSEGNFAFLRSDGTAGRWLAADAEL